MDSDLSLLEIAGEDDSLLQIPRDDSGGSSIFSCSPLHCLRSLPPRTPRTDGKVGEVGIQKLTSSSQDGINKENINGVLNSLELSMISGNHSNTNNELTIIHEEEENTLVGEADIVGTSSELQEIEENLFKQLSEDKKIGACLQPNSQKLTKDTLASASLENSISDTHPPPRLQQQLVTEGNKGLKLQPPLQVCSTGEKMQQTQFQTAKPSGLRMPSPSLGFFSQQKALSSRVALHKSSNPCKPKESNPPKSKKVAENSFHEDRLPHAPMKSCENVNGAAKSCTPNLGLSDVKPEPKVQCYSLGSGEIAEQEKVDKTPEHVNKKSLEQVEPLKIEYVLKTEDMEFPINDNKLLSDSGMDEPLETKVNENLFVFQEPESMHRTSTGKDNLLNIEQNDMKQEVDEQTKPFTCDAQISNGSLVLQANHDTSFKNSRHSGEFKEYNYMNTVQVNSSQRDFSETATGASLEGIPCQSTEEVKDEHFTSQICQMEQVNCGSRVNDMPVNKDCDMSEFQCRVDSSPKCTSLHCDSLISQHDDHRNSEQQTSLLTSSKMKYMLYENESSVANHRYLLDQSDSFEASANSDSDTKDHTKDLAESPSGLHEHKLLAQAISEPDFTERVIENSPVKDAKVLFSDEKLTEYCCNSSPSTSIAKDQFLLVVDSINKESPLLEIQRPSLVDNVDFQHVNLNSDLLPSNNACSEETRKEDALEQCNDYTSEYSTSNHHILATPVIEDGSLDEDEGLQCLQMNVSEEVSAKIDGVELTHDDNAANSVSSVQGSEDQITDVVDWNCNEHCSLSESLKLEVTDNLTPYRRISQGSKPSSLKRKSLSEEAENSTSGEDEISITNVQNQIAEGGSEIICHKKCATKRKEDVAIVIPPPNAAPFSDEWLAAMEAAGEEILTMKGGAVQNSPPDKPQHEPGPWSPVRRKNQAIGPYDCTKCTKMNISDSSS
ncbi:uncharacterized protein G2W53_021601 [Senna tora]|uniref:Uncharacterized protein n=1 Tax=Senna tora TaxID=362788 RepID=A0A834TLC3_9FABA|nr:uncharacterized protein G2W53_021601 [Senna tora]